MPIVDSSEWKEFTLGDIFPTIIKPDVLHSREVVESPTGIPYVVRTKFNNGVKFRVEPIEGIEPSPGGVITFGAENSMFFYQDEPFLSGRDIYYIDTRTHNKNICLFLTSCFQKITGKYSYNYGLFPELLKQERIILPTSSNGEPDWNMMDIAMSKVLNSAEIMLADLKGIRQVRNRVDTQRWRKFRIGGDNGLFKIRKGTRLTRANMTTGTIPFIGASTANNGITEYIGNTEEIHPGNVITVAYNGQKATGKAFYQPNPFWASDDVHVLYPNFELNELRALFLLPIFRIVGRPYAFEDKWKIEYMEKSELPLPVDENGEPDWPFIECSMRNIISEGSNVISSLTDFLKNA